MRTHLFSEQLYKKMEINAKRRERFLAKQKAIINGTPGELTVEQFREKVKAIRKLAK